MATDDQPRPAREHLQDLAAVLRTRYVCQARVLGATTQPSLAVARGGGAVRVACEMDGDVPIFRWAGHEPVRGMEAAAEAIVRSVGPAPAALSTADHARMPNFGESMDQ